MSKKLAIQRYFESDFSRREHVVHMCLNADCFYCETVIGAHDAVWKEAWDSNVEDIAAYPCCPSCDEVLWREVWDDTDMLFGGLKNGTETT